MFCLNWHLFVVHHVPNFLFLTRILQSQNKQRSCHSLRDRLSVNMSERVKQFHNDKRYIQLFQSGPIEGVRVDLSKSVSHKIPEGRKKTRDVND